MPDADKELKIRITSEADQSGFNQAKQGVEGISGFTPENMAGMEKYKNLLREAGEGTENLHHQVNHLRGLMRGLGPEIGEIGHLLHFALNPEFLIGAAGLAAIEGYFHWLEKIQETQREIIKDMSTWNQFQRELISLGGNVYDNQQKIAQATAEAAAAQRSLTAALKEYEDQARVYNQQEQDAMQNRIENRKTESTLMQDQIDMLEAMHGITSSQAAQQKLQVEHQEKLQEIADKPTQAKQAYNSAQSDYERELKLAGGPGAFSPEAIGKATADSQQANTLRDQAALIIKNASAQDTKFEETIAKIKNAQQSDPIHWNQYSDQILETERQKKTFDNQVSAAKKDLPQLTDNAAAAAQHLKDIQNLKDKFDGLANSVEVLKQKMIDAQANAPKETADENRSYATKSTSQAVKGGASPQSIFNDAVSAMETLNGLQANTGHSAQEFLQRGTPQQKDYIQHLQNQVAALGNLETAIGNNGQAFVARINAIVKTQSTHAEVLNHVADYARNIDAQLQNIKQKVQTTPYNGR